MQWISNSFKLPGSVCMCLKMDCDDVALRHWTQEDPRAPALEEELPKFQASCRLPADKEPTCQHKYNTAGCLLHVQSLFWHIITHPPPPALGDQINSRNCCRVFWAKSQHGGKLPTFGTSRNHSKFQIWLITIKVRSWLVYATIFSGLVLRVGFI